MESEPPGGTMPKALTTTEEPDLSDAPEDLRVFMEGLAACGITATLPKTGAEDPVLDPLYVPGVSLSEALEAIRSES
jgi:hypothetical protein